MGNIIIIRKSWVKSFWGSAKWAMCELHHESATVGCRFCMRWLNLCKNEPTEETILANRTLEILICSLNYIRYISTILLEVPIKVSFGIPKRDVLSCSVFQSIKLKTTTNISKWTLDVAFYLRNFVIANYNKMYILNYSYTLTINCKNIHKLQLN